MPETIDVEQPPTFDRRVLAALISVNDPSIFHQTAPSRQIETIDHELWYHSLRNLPTDNVPREFS